MRLSNYLLEYEYAESSNWDIPSWIHPDELIVKIKKDCQPFLKLIKGHSFLWRGSNLPYTGGYGKFSPRTNRKPRDLQYNLHDAFNLAFKKKFGWYARSEGLFCNGNKHTITQFGVPVMIFPIGAFKYIWSRDVVDLYTFVREYFGQRWTFIDAEVKDILASPEFQRIVKSYSNRDFAAALNADVEIIINCKQYYLVDYVYSKYKVFQELIR